MTAWYNAEKESQARAYDRIQGQLFLLRFGLLFAAAAAFWLSGLAEAVAAGLATRFTFPLAWPLVCSWVTALAVAGYEVLLFPLSVLDDYSIERAYGRLRGEFGQWLRGYLLSMLFEIGLLSGAFTGLYALHALLPNTWWLMATWLYGTLVGGLGKLGPAWLLPRVRPPVPITDEDLLAELRRVGKLAGLEITGAGWWNFDYQDDLDAVQLTGWGRRRQVVFTERAWRELDRRELVFLAARLMGWEQRHAALGMHLLHLTLTAAIFWGGGIIVAALAQSRGDDAIHPAILPFWVVVLFGLAAVAGVVVHAVGRRGELRADQFALRHVGGADTLQTCLRHEFEREPFALDAAWWQVLLLRKTPTPAHRLAQAAALPRATDV